MTVPSALPPAAVRRTALAALLVAFVHVVFGAIVRISGSGMGCGDHWPRCFDPASGKLYFFPPLSRPDLVIEVTHRYLAATLFVALAALFTVAWQHRRAAGVAGRGGVLRAAGLALGFWIAPALFGAVTVFLGNPPWATVVHKLLAAALVGVLAATVVRAGGLGGRATLGASGSPRAFRGAVGAAGLALVAVVLGGLTAKIPGANAACAGFPLCGAGSAGGGAQHVQLTHRVVAYLLAFHILGLTIGFTRRRETAPVLAAVRTALVVVLLQVTLGALMVTVGLYPALRSAHQATGMLLWLTTFTMAYLARRAAGLAPVAGAPDARPTRPTAGVSAPAEARA